MPSHSQPAISACLARFLVFVGMKATSYNKEHEAMFGLAILIVTSLAALMILALKLYFMV